MIYFLGEIQRAGLNQKRHAREGQTRHIFFFLVETPSGNPVATRRTVRSAVTMTTLINNININRNLLLLD